MAKCSRCGKKGIFLKVDSSGHCSDCAAVVLAKRKAESEQRRTESQTPRKTIFDVKWYGSLPRYTYTKVKLDTPVIYPASMMSVGSVCGFFRMEPDSDFIEVHISYDGEDLLIGFLPSGRLAEMAGDWFDRSWTSGGQISSIDGKDVYIDMAFWVPSDVR